MPRSVLARRALAVVDACALPPAPILMPQPPSHVTSPVKLRLIAGSMPLVSKATVPMPVLNSQSAIWLFSKRLPPAATVPSYSVKARDSTRFGSTWVTGMPLENAVTAASIVLAFEPQSVQQLWNSSRRRTTSREIAGLSRLIFERAAA